jgi:hypothetical protein
MEFQLEKGLTQTILKYCDYYKNNLNSFSDSYAEVVELVDAPDSKSDFYPAILI